MADTTFVAGTPIVKEWLNDVNDTVYGLPNTTSIAAGDALVGVKRTVSVAVAETLHGWIEGATLQMSAGNGFAGDNTTNDTAAFNAACAALSLLGGGTLRGVYGKTYKCNTDVTVADGVRVDLNGGTVNFTWAAGSDVSGFDMRNNTALYNGVVNGVEAGAPTSSNKDLHCPIYVGRTGANLAGYRNVHIYDLTITNNRGGTIGGRGVLVQSGSSNVTVENLWFPDSSTIGTLVQVSWAGPGGSPPATSEHPHDIIVRNIKFGTMTKAGSSFDVAAIDIVGAYNVKVENIRGVRWAGDAVWQVRPGGFGDTVAPAAIKPLLFKGIEIFGISCETVDNYHGIVNGKANDAAGTPIMSIPCKIGGIAGVGPGSSSTTAAIRITTVYDVELHGFDVSYFDKGVLVDDTAKRIKIRDGRVHHCNEDGLQIVHANNPEDVLVQRVESYLNGQDGGSRAGFYAEACQRVIFEDCISGDATGETAQLYGFRVLSTAGNTQFRGNFNRVRDFKAGGQKYLFQAAVRGDRSFHGGSSATLSTGFTEFVPLQGVGAPNATEQVASVLTAENLVLTNFRVKLSAAPTGATKSRGLRIVDDGSATALEVAIVNTATTAQDFDAVEVAAGSELSVQSLVTNAPNAAYGKWSCEAFLN